MTKETHNIAQPAFRVRVGDKLVPVPEEVQKDPNKLSTFVLDQIVRAPLGVNKAELELYMQRGNGELEPGKETSREFSFGQRGSKTFRDNMDFLHGMYQALEQNRLKEVAKFDAAKLAGGELAEKFANPPGKSQAAGEGEKWTTPVSTIQPQ